MTFEKAMICGLLIAVVSCIATYTFVYLVEIKSYINHIKTLKKGYEEEIEEWKKAYENYIRTLKENHEEEIEEWKKAYDKSEDANYNLSKELEKSRRYNKSAEASSKMWKDSYMKNFIH